MSLLANSNAIESGGYNIDRSLRFRSSASAYLSRTPASSSNRKIWTWSAWVKRGKISDSVIPRLFSAGADSNNKTEILFLATDEIRFLSTVTGTSRGLVDTVAKYRDPSAWYHIIVSLNAGSANVSVYVNNVLQSTTVTTAVQNIDHMINSTNIHRISDYFGGTANFDGYLAEVNFIDGQALTPSSFGETSTETGVWVPKKYTGTYGTNGFYLPFSDNTSATTLAYDKSGNGNNWTPNNISTTAGATYDSMTDVPTLTSATAANYCVLNPLKNYAMGPTDGNLSVSSSASTAAIILGTIGMTSGKWYWEFTQTSFATTNAPMIGIATDAVGMTNYVGTDAYGWGYFGNNGQKQNAGTATAYGASYTNNDVIGVAFDADAGTLVFYKNNVSQGTAFTGLTSGPYFPAFSDAGTTATTVANVNFGQRPFSFSAPTGFKPLNTFNLP